MTANFRTPRFLLIVAILASMASIACHASAQPGTKDQQPVASVLQPDPAKEKAKGKLGSEFDGLKDEVEKIQLEIAKHELEMTKHRQELEKNKKTLHSLTVEKHQELGEFLKKSVNEVGDDVEALKRLVELQKVHAALQAAKSQSPQSQEAQLQRMQDSPQLQQLQRMLGGGRGLGGLGGARPNPAPRTTTKTQSPTEKMLGIQIASDPAKLPNPKGIEIVGVDAGSNADKAGIKVGDVLVSADGKAVPRAPVKEMEQMIHQQFLSGVRTAFPIDIVVLRDGKEQTIRGVIIPGSPGGAAAPAVSTGAENRLGISTIQIASDGSSLYVMIRQVTPDSPAAKAGLKARDILRMVDGRTVPDSAVAYRKFLDETRTNAPLIFVVLRDGKEQNIPGVIIPDGPPTAAPAPPKATPNDLLRKQLNRQPKSKTVKPNPN